MPVALVAGATRGAGRAIAVELARAGFFVYATGRSSRATGPSEIGRPETIEETGDLIRAAGGAGAARVVDHEDPSQVAALVAAIDDERGRLDVLVNDIFGGRPVHAMGQSPCGSTTCRAGCFRSGFTPVRLAIVTCSRTRSARPQRPARAMIGTRPTSDTRSGSSNDTCVFSHAAPVAAGQVP